MKIIIREWEKVWDENILKIDYIMYFINKFILYVVIRCEINKV